MTHVEKQKNTLCRSCSYVPHAAGNDDASKGLGYTKALMLMCMTTSGHSHVDTLDIRSRSSKSINILDMVYNLYSTDIQYILEII